MKKEKIVKEFRRIKSLGFIKSRRSHNTGIGKTFEDYLGIQENNQRDTDFEGFEIKSQKFFSKSKITLFTKSPTYPEKANHLIREKYGKIDIHCASTKIIHTSFFGDRFNKYLDKFGFKIEIDSHAKKIFLVIKDLLKEQIVENEIYYSFDDIIESTKKLNKLFVVTAETKIIQEKEHFHYTKAVIFKDFNFNKFLKLIKKGKIQYDIRIGLYRSGINICKPHDHGSGFRVNRNSLSELFKEIIEVD